MKKTIEFPTLKVTIETQEKKSIYVFEGDLDENFKAGEIPLPTFPWAAFNLEKIAAINSIGIREWIKMIENFRPVENFVFEKCSITFVDQMNMVPDSIGHATVKSFYGPYFRDCNQCNGERNCLIEGDADMAAIANMLTPKKICGDCNEELEFDALEESYFSFLRK